MLCLSDGMFGLAPRYVGISLHLGDASELVRFHKGGIRSQLGVAELYWTTQSSDLNQIQHLWDESPRSYEKSSQRRRRFDSTCLEVC